MSKNNIYEQSLKELSEYKNIIQTTKKQIFTNAIMRLVFFTTPIVLVFFSEQINTPFFVALEVLFFIIFVFLVRYNIKLNKKLKFHSELVQIIKERQQALNENYSGFHAGSEFIDSSHAYTYDIDIFGENSIFQLLNRSLTLGGKIRLAEKLQNIETNVSKLKQYSKAVEELSRMKNFRDNFSASARCAGNINEPKSKETTNSILKNLMQWTQREASIKNKKMWGILLYLLPTAALTALTFLIAGIASPLILIIIVGIQIAITGSFSAKVNLAHGDLSNKSNLLEKYEILLNKIAVTNFKSAHLQDIQGLINSKNNSALKQLKQIRRLLKAFDLRLNFIVSIFFNYLLIWDLQILFRLEKLKEQLKINMPQWFAALSEFDSLMSLSEFAYINPNYAYPEFSEDEFCFEIKNGMHPLLPSANRVGNNFKLFAGQKIFIVTGANMSGKSTFLRTLSVNSILACTGTKVCADAFHFTPTPMYTSVRTTDSVQKNESYFYAELMRLKNIITQLKKGKRLFIILDEMLKGTNSQDKHIGSKALLEQMVRYNVFGFAATHDTELGILEKEYPEVIQNCRFEAEIHNDELFFDYKIKNGVSKNLNAVFLMKKHGIIPE